jgi:hypothetical protein
MTTRGATWILLRWLVVAVVMLPATEGDAKFKCVPTSKCTDRTVLSDVRAAIEAACLCVSQTSKKTYRKCAKNVIKARKSALSGGFPRPCQREAKKGVVNSICGRPGFVLCNKTNEKGTKTVCRVTREEKCANVPGRSDVCDDSTSCLDACNPSGGCNHLWGRNLGATLSAQVHDVAVDSQGNLLAGGEWTGSVDFGDGSAVASSNTDAFVAKYSSDGTLLWKTVLGQTGVDRVRGVAVLPNDNVVATGMYTVSIDVGGGAVAAQAVDIFVVVLDGTDGSIVTGRVYGGTGDDQAWDAAVDSAGNVLIGGTFLSASLDFSGGAVSALSNESASRDAFVTKLDGNLAFVWQRSPTVNDDNDLYRLTTDSQNRVIVVGEFVGDADWGGGNLVNGVGGDAFIVSLLQNGAHWWSRSLAGNGFTASDAAYDVTIGADDDVFVTGRVAGGVNFGAGSVNGQGNGDAFVARYREEGSYVTAQRFGDGMMQSGRALTFDGDGNLIVSGGFEGTIDLGGGGLDSLGDEDIFLAKFGASGTLLWSVRHGGVDIDRVNRVAANASGIFLGGSFRGALDLGNGLTTSIMGPDTDGFLAKTAP